MKTNLLAVAACGLLLSGVAQAAEIRVLASGAVKETLIELAPEFEKASSNKLAITWSGTVDIKKKIAAGEVFDLIIVASPEMDAFVKQGKIAANGKVDLVKSMVGVAVKAGAPKPDVSSGEKLKQALIAAKSVGYSTGPSGVYLLTMFEKMGIADQIKAKAKVTTPGTPVATLIRNGDAEIGFQQVSELIHQQGIEFLGPISADVQNITVFSSGVHADSKEQAGARALQKFLTAPAAVPVIKKHGLEPAGPAPQAS